ncbi:MAG TPA: MerR family transcriptional regulator [Thermoanaerobaculia bacterium]|jgi:DNA-binding transcriptional MerR regulator
MTADPDESRLYKIGEVCKLADVQPYVLRYWETEFPQLAPNKSGGGQRMYTRREIDVILRIKQLLYSEGFTIAGAKKKLEEEPAAAVAPAAPPAKTTRATKAKSDATTKALVNVKKELAAILRMLDE